MEYDFACRRSGFRVLLCQGAVMLSENRSRIDYEEIEHVLAQALAHDFTT